MPPYFVRFRRIFVILMFPLAIWGRPLWWIWKREAPISVDFVRLPTPSLYDII